NDCFYTHIGCKSNHFSFSGCIPAAIEKYCVICDWSQLVTWYKAVVNGPVPCDLCDHSQISHVVSNDVTLHDRDLTQRCCTMIGVPLCLEDTVGT
ncbi:unnamed protein product, partial [Staurois parvus]